MPPRRASVGAKKKIVKTVRPVRKSAAAAAAAEETLASETAAETPAATEASASEATAATEASASEATAATEEVTREFPAPEEITPQAAENPTLGTPTAAAGETTAAVEDASAGSSAAVVTPQAAEAPASEIPPAATARAASESATVMEEDKATTGCNAPEIIPQPAGSDAQQNDPVPAADAGLAPAEGEEAAVVEPADATEVVEATPVVKRTTKRVRKVTRRIPVKRTPNKKEPEPVAGKEDKGDEGGEDTASLPLASTEGEQNPNGAEAVSLSVEAQSPSGAEAVPMSVEGPNPNGAEAAPISVEEPNPVSCPEQPSAVEVPTAHVEAAVSAAAASSDGASPAVVPQKRVKKVKKIIVVKRTVKAKEVSKKEEKVEEADAEAAEKVASRGSDANTIEPAKEDRSGMEVEAASVPDASLTMEENKVPESCKDDAEKGNASGSDDAEVEGAGTDGGSAGDQMVGMSEGQKRRKTEIFIGGLDRNAKEEDIRKVFEKVGEIVEIRMMMDKKTGKNKGYAFLRYATAAQAKQAVTEFTKVEVCGKQCGAAALEGNDTIFLGNIDKKWKKDDVIKLLHGIGIEKLDTVTLMLDPKNPDCNRGFAFLDFETNKDAQTAFKKLQKKDVFGKGRNIKVAWAEPLSDPDEEEMQKVKSVFAEGIPSSWDEKKVREHFKRFGQIERVVLSRNMHSAKRKDFAFVNFTTREAALSCIESYDKDLTNDDSEVNVKVSLAKPVQKNKQNKAGIKSSDKDSKVKPKAVQRDTKINISLKSQSSRGAHGNVREDKSSTTRELLNVLREQAAWKQHSYPRGPAIPDHSGALHGGKRPLSALGDNAHYADPRGYPRARLDSAYPVAGPSYGSLSHSMTGTSLEYHQQSRVGYGTGSVYGAVDASRTPQGRPANPPYGSGHYSR